MSIRIAILQFPGSNCERETSMAVKRAGMEPVEFLWNEAASSLSAFDGYIIVGGFSYEDRGRAGMIAACDPIMLALKAEAEKGKPILGICNGAQILVESGLVPGLPKHKLAMALTENKRVVAGKILGTGYYNQWIHMRLSDEYQRNAYTRFLNPKDILHVPVAHAEGRFVIPPALLQEIKVQGLQIFQYCDEKGEIHSHFPINPNGSIDNIAAIANKAGNIMAMMPHPERTPNGDPIFDSMRDYIVNGKYVPVSPLFYTDRDPEYATYKQPQNTYTLTVELIIADNHALTVQKAFAQCGLVTKVKRYTYWEVETDSLDTFNAIKRTGVLFNERKEMPAVISSAHPAFLVQAKEDLIGKASRQLLEDCFSIQGINALKHGIIWQFYAENVNMDHVLQTNIIHNPYAHDCYQYKY